MSKFLGKQSFDRLCRFGGVVGRLEQSISKQRVKGQDTVQWLNRKLLFRGSDGKVIPLIKVSRSRWTSEGAEATARIMQSRSDRLLEQGVGCWFHFILTFRDGLDKGSAWAVVGPERRRFMNKLQGWVKRSLGGQAFYLGVVEAQTANGRDFPHVHIVIGLPSAVTVRKLKSLAAVWWQHGFVKVKLIRGDASGAVKYVMKYVHKDVERLADLEVSELPEWWLLFSLFNVRRFSFSRAFSLTILQKLPFWVKEEILKENLLERLRGARKVSGGWACDFQFGNEILDILFKHGWEMRDRVEFAGGVGFEK